jgi:hypothetical protein
MLGKSIALRNSCFANISLMHQSAVCLGSPISLASGPTEHWLFLEDLQPTESKSSLVASGKCLQGILMGPLEVLLRV